MGMWKDRLNAATAKARNSKYAIPQGADFAWGDEDIARERLNKAAPDLLAAAEGLTILGMTEDGAYIVGPQGMANLGAAIKKAKGTNG